MTDQLHGPVSLPPIKEPPTPMEQAEVWWASTASLYISERRETPSPSQNCTLEYPAHSLVTMLTELSQLPSQCTCNFLTKLQ